MERARLPLLETLQNSAVRALEACPHALGPGVREPLEVVRQRHLVREIVIDHPFAPGELEPIPIERQSAEQPQGSRVRGRSGVEGDPTNVREIDFDPTMRVARTYDEVLAEFVVLAGQEA